MALDLSGWQSAFSFSSNILVKQILQKPEAIPCGQMMLPEFSHRPCLKSNWIMTLNYTIWCVHSLLLQLEAQSSSSSILQELVDFWGGL